MFNAHRGKRRAKKRGILDRFIFFNVLFLYLELVLHVYMGTDLRYAPIYVIYSLAAGSFFAALTMPFPKAVNGILCKVFAVIISLVYVVEIIAKKILQSYYPLSTLGTAADNRLGDYADVIVSTVIHSIPIIVVLFLPAILLFIFGKTYVGYGRMALPMSGIALVLALIFHLVGLGVVHLPWGGDLTPRQLYRVDTNIDDQVEQLGLWNMMRLDLKHMIIPVKSDLDSNFGDLSTLGGDSSGSTSEPDSSEEPGPVIDTSPNVMNVDLQKIANESSKKDIQWLANYFNSVTPTKKNEYTGMFKGYNVIELVLEGFSGYVIDPNLTPTLYKLTHEGFVFHNYYTALHFTSTSNGECQTLLGLYPNHHEAHRRAEDQHVLHAAPAAEACGL